jgi:hypothetical protein
MDSFRWQTVKLPKGTDGTMYSFSTSLRNHSVRSGVVIRDASPMLKGRQCWEVRTVATNI